MTAYPGGGFVVTGRGSAGGDIVANGGEGGLLVARLEADGTLLWAKVYGGSLGRSVSVTEEGDIWAAGSTELDMWVLKLNADGDLLWERAFGGSGDDQGFSVAAMPDGGCAVTGYTRSTDGDLVTAEGPVDPLGNDDIYVLRLAANGDLLWQRRMGDDWVDDGTGVCIGDDGHIYVGGSYGEDAFVAKFTYEGDLVWVNSYGGSSYDHGYGICAVDGGVAFTGVTGSNDGDVGWSPDGEDFWVARVDLDGDLVWSRTPYHILWVPTAPSVGYAIARTPDDGVAVATFCDWQSDRNFAPWYFSPTGGGGLMGFYGGPGEEICYGIAVDEADGGIGVCGKTGGSDGGDVSGSNGLDAWVIKLSTTIGVEENAFANGASVWYDGVQVVLAVTGSLEVSGVRLWDVQGRLVFDAALPAGGGRVQLPDMNAGIFVAEAIGNNGRMATRALAIGQW